MLYQQYMADIDDTSVTSLLDEWISLIDSSNTTIVAENDYHQNQQRSKDLDG